MADAMQRVLLVEDEDVLRRSLERFLVRSGRPVRAVGERAQALALLESGGFDLLVTDLVLPDGSGGELVEQASARGMEVIVITAYGTPAARTRLAARGVACLAKPFDLGRLEVEVERALTRRGRATP
jgi:two-component system cell cycle response regulator CpdR